MSMIYMQISGCAIFFISTIIFGLLLRKYPSENVRKTTTMALHFIAFVAFLLPVLFGIFYPGLSTYDELLGIQSLPYRPLGVAFGAILIPIGIFFIVFLHFALLEHGHGPAVFFIT